MLVRCRSHGRDACKRQTGTISCSWPLLCPRIGGEIAAALHREFDSRAEGGSERACAANFRG